MTEKHIKTFNDLFKFYESGKACFKQCLDSEEECDCHYSGTLTVIVQGGGLMDIVFKNGIVKSISPH
jgi:hypothetical protein